jgi:FeS assembly SUF system protein
MFSFFSKRSKTSESAPAAVADRIGNDPEGRDSVPSQATPSPDTGGEDLIPSPAPSSPDTPVMNGDLNVGALLQAPPAPAPAAFGPADPDRTDVLKPSIVDAISTVFDPEIPVNIYELGLIYEILADAESRVLVRMTLTSPACPSAQQLPSEVRYKIKALEGVAECTVDIVWEPPWTKDMMSETARLSLGMF